MKNFKDVDSRVLNWYINHLATLWNDGRTKMSVDAIGLRASSGSLKCPWYCYPEFRDWL